MTSVLSVARPIDTGAPSTVSSRSVPFGRSSRSRATGASTTGTLKTIVWLMNRGSDGSNGSSPTGGSVLATDAGASPSSAAAAAGASAAAGTSGSAVAGTGGAAVAVRG